MRYQPTDIKIGQRFGRLAIVKEDGKFYQPSGQAQRAFLCKCDCGNTKRVRLSALVNGRTTSCSCDKHGYSGTSLHGSWRGMKNRVKPNAIDADRYFARGITVCDEWQKFIAFKNWALANGYKDGLTIDRIDNSKGYYPENCRFVSNTINVNNRDCTFMVNYNGVEQSFMLLLHEKGLFEHMAAIRTRIKRGWKAQKAFDTPIRTGEYKRGKRAA